MVKGMRVYEYGAAEVMKWEDIEIGEPKSGEVKLKNKAIGINYLDVYMRQGVVRHGAPPLPETPPLPFTPGMEAAGVVIAVGPGVTTCNVGDLVAYAGFPVCAYAEELILPAERVVPVPPSVDPIVAAAVIFKGLTAEVLVRRCFKGSIACLKVRGYIVSFGQPSGSPSPLDFSAISQKSLFFTIPSVMLYTEARDELLAASEELYSNVEKGVLKVRVNHKYPLSQAVQAHSDLENQKTTGSVVLIPDN